MAPSSPWDVLRSFFSQMGFHQTLVAMDLDILTMNPEFEKSELQDALSLVVSRLNQDCIKIHSSESYKEQLVADHFGVEAKPHCKTIKEISQLLANNQARNNISNQREFLVGERASPTCARMDAKSLDRDVQMKYDIAKNDDGPLRRTLKPTSVEDHPRGEGSEGIETRIQDLETHLAIRYVPSMPTTFLGRLQHLEEYLIQLERDFPPWAALHFNQPRRRWPPPPRATPMVVSPHLRVADAKVGSQQNKSSKPEALPPVDGVASRNTGSSLQKAIAERLQVRQALADMEK